MYAAIAPKWWRVLVAIISVKALRPPKIGQGLEGPQIDDLEPWPQKRILDNIDNYNYGQHVKLLTFTYWLLILCYNRIFSCIATNKNNKICAYWTWYQLKKAKTFYSPAFFIATEATAAVGSLLVIMAIICQWFDILVDGCLVISSDIFFEIYLIYFVIILFDIYALTDQPGPLGCQDRGTFHRCIFL